MFVIVVRFDLGDDRAATAFDTLTATALPFIVETEPGTLVYAVHRVEGEPWSRVFYEVYADRAAHAAHEANPPTRRFLDQLQPLLSGSRVEFLETPAGKGVPESAERSST